jgi:hypothetical protein
MHFETKHRTVFSPENAILHDFYKVLEKYAAAVGDSRLFEDFIDIYETLDTDLKEGEK